MFPLRASYVGHRVVSTARGRELQKSSAFDARHIKANNTAIASDRRNNIRGGKKKNFFLHIRVAKKSFVPPIFLVRPVPTHKRSFEKHFIGAQGLGNRCVALPSFITEATSLRCFSKVASSQDSKNAPCVFLEHTNQLTLQST